MGHLLGLLPPRPRPQPRLSLGRGRPARLLRPRGAPVLRARALERTRPDPEGAPLWPHRQRGQPRRGREGGVVLSRFDADPFLRQGALQISAGRVPVRGPRRGEPAPRPGRPRVRARRHRRLRRRTLLRRHRRVRQARAGRRPHPHHRGQPRSRPRPAPPAADALVPQHLDLGLPARRHRPTSPAPPRTRRPHPRQPRDARRLRAGGGHRSGRHRAADHLHRERHQQRQALRVAERLSVREGRVPRARGGR